MSQMDPMEYIELLEDMNKDAKVLGKLDALGMAIELMCQLSAEYERDGTAEQFIVSQRMIREVVELKAVIQQSHFKN